MVEEKSHPRNLFEGKTSHRTLKVEILIFTNSQMLDLCY